VRPIPERLLILPDQNRPRRERQIRLELLNIVISDPHAVDIQHIILKPNHVTGDSDHTFDEIARIMGWDDHHDVAAGRFADRHDLGTEDGQPQTIRVFVDEDEIALTLTVSITSLALPDHAVEHRPVVAEGGQGMPHPGLRVDGALRQVRRVHPSHVSKVVSDGDLPTTHHLGLGRLEKARRAWPFSECTQSDDL